jgi:hypothetical protein
MPGGAEQRHIAASDLTQSILVRLRSASMAGVAKTEWFGKQVSVLMVNNKTVTGELSETSDRYIVLTIGKSEMQIMVHAIIAIRPAGAPDVQQ